MLMKKKKPLMIIPDESSKGNSEAAKPNSQTAPVNYNEMENQNELENLNRTKKGPKEYKMTEEEKELNRKILKNMNRKQNFVKNPRFRNNAKCMLYSNALFSDILNSENPFVVEPIIVTFREYQLNCVYQIDLKLTNRKQILTSFKYIPPVTENFSIKKIIYPKKDTGLIAPGMHAKLEILFNATSLDNFEDEISIVTETFAFRIPLRSIRELPALSLDNPMMCGKCLLGDQTSMVFRCKNNGGDAHFKFNVREEFALNNNSNNHSNNQSQIINLPNNSPGNQMNNINDYISNNNNNNANNNNSNTITKNNINNNTGQINTNSNLNSNSVNLSNISEQNSPNNNTNNQIQPYTNSKNSNSINQQDNEVLNVGPFSIFPQEFYLYKGMSVEVYVNFNPQTEGIIEKDLIICCDSKINLNQKIIGEGISIDFQIIALDGILVDESIEKLEYLYFEDAYPSTVSSRNLKIKNLSSVPLRFHWSIYDMYENKNFTLKEDEDYFTIFPVEGVFEPLQEISFLVNFQPKNSRNYEQKLDLIIEDVPFQAVKNFNPHLISSRNNPNTKTVNSNTNVNGNKESKNFSALALKKNTFTKGEPFLLALNSPYPSYPIFSFNLKGKGKQCYLDVSSKIIDFGVVYIGEKISKEFQLFNPKSGLIKFKISKILQSIKKKASITDSDPITKVNNFFKWSEPGSTITDHFRTNCIFKLKKPNEENLEKIISRVNKEFNLQGNINNNNNLDLLSDNDTPSVLASGNNNINSKNNVNKFISDINLKNLAAGFNNNNNNNNYLCLRINNNSKNNLNEEVEYLKLFVNKEFLFRKEREISPKTKNNKWTTKVKNSKISSSNKKTNQANCPTNNNHINQGREENAIAEKNNLNTKVIKRDLSHDSAKNGKSFKNNLALKQLDRISINSAVSKSKEKMELNNFNNKNSNNYNNNLNNLNLQNSLIVDEYSFNTKSNPTSTYLAKSPSGAPSTSRKGINTNSNSRLIQVNVNSKANNQALTVSDDIALVENLDLRIKKDEILKVNLTFMPLKLGLFKSSIIVIPDDGIPFSIDFKANVVGPQITVDTPCIDFGLFAVNEIKTAKIKIKNTSRTIARFLIKETRFKNINFDNYIDSDYISENEGVIHEPKIRKKIKTLQDFENYGLREIDMEVIDNYEMKFSPIFGTIQENQEQEITVTFVSAYPKYKFDQIEIMVMHSDSVFVNYHADCQEAYAYLNKTLILPKDIYVSVPITFENNSLQIVNPSNLPISFEWENLNIEDEKYIEFSPTKGTVPPKSSVVILYRMIFYSIKDLDEIYYCKINELDVPFGVNLKGFVTGLDIVYELTDESFNQFNLSKFESLSMNSSLTGNSIVKRTMNLKESKKLSFLDNNFQVDKTLKFLDFKNLKVNKSHSIKFLVKNLSGISTNFHFESKNYNPGIEKDLKYNISKYPHLNPSETQLSRYNSTINSNTNSNFGTMNNFNNNNNKDILSHEMNSTTNKNLSTINLQRRNFGNSKTNKLFIGHPLLSDYHESINFTSAKGNEFTKMRQLEKDSVLYLSSKKGVAITIEPKQGRLDPHTEQLISITIYNECVGDFEDELIANVKGLAERRFPISLRIRGNPLQLAPFQPGIDYNESPPILKMGYVTTNVNNINKSFKVINTGANLISLDWKIFDYDEILNPKSDIFKVKIAQKKNKENFSLNYIPYEPEEKEDFGYFKIAPKNILIQPKGMQDLNVCFSTDMAGIKSALLVAYPKFIDDSKTLNVRLSELALRVDAYGVKPNLVVDKRVDFEGNYRYRFYIHSYGINPKPKRSIVLINQEKINLIIRLQLEGPYKIINTEPLEASIGYDSKSFNIIPKSNLKIEIKAIIPDQKNFTDWPITLVNEKHGKLTVIFENGESKEYLLTTVFKRPRIALNTTGNDAIEGPNYIDFASVNCESYKKASIYIKNLTDVLTDWQINYVKFKPKKSYGYGTTTTDEKEDIAMTDDPDMFLFNITSGEIHGPSIMLMNIPLGPGLPQVPNENNKKYSPIKIDIMFKPKKNIFYKCRYKITTSTGNSIDFILKGYGSYMEERIEN